MPDSEASPTDGGVSYQDGDTEVCRIGESATHKMDLFKIRTRVLI